VRGVGIIILFSGHDENNIMGTMVTFVEKEPIVKKETKKRKGLVIYKFL
jgi:hypothetical protein